YYVDNSGERHTCLIKDLKWQKNPAEILYYTMSDGTVKKKGIDDIREFGFVNGVKYKRFTISTNQADNRTEKNTYLFKELVDGEVSLFSYNDGSNIAFFYQRKGEKLKELVFANSTTSDKGSLYKEQLTSDVNCKGKSAKEIEKLRYYRDDLIRYFISYNKCTGKDYNSLFEEKAFDTDERLGLTFRAGMSVGEFDLDLYRGDRHDVTFNKENEIRLGVEADFAIPQTNKNLALILELFYTQYMSEQTYFPAPGNTAYLATVDFKALGLAIGLRYFLRISPQSRLFANGNVAVTQAFNSEIELGTLSEPLNVSTQIDLSYGIGYSFNNRFFFEYRKNLNSDWFGPTSDFNSEYKSHAFILGYRIKI
ncbi:MAG: hypothetical protein WBA74_15695, partial [Cyclobacteriaceae bacterium]